MGGGLNATLNYDPADRLGWVWSTTNGVRRFVFDGDDIIAELDNSANTVRRYVHGPGTDNPIVCIGVVSSCAPGAGTTEKIWLLSDLRGSVITYVGEITIAGGQRAEVGTDRRNRYDAFGLMSTTNNESLFAYTGQIFLPEIGLYHFKARQYNPDLGRFMQTDPIGYEDGTNIYAYVGNDPINLVDPTGTQGFANEFIGGFVDTFQSPIALARNEFAIQNGNLQAQRVAAATDLVSSVALDNPVDMLELGVAVTANNPSRSAGRAAANGVISSILGVSTTARSTMRTGLSRLAGRNGARAERVGALASGAAIGGVNFSTIQRGQVIQALTNFDNQLSSAGFSLDNVPIGALTSLGRSAAAGADFDFSLDTGILTVGSDLGTENANVTFSQQIFTPFP